jgi:MFS family permease
MLNAEPEPVVPGFSIANLRLRLLRSARHGYRFSWFSWGAAFAVAVGGTLALFILVRYGPSLGSSGAPGSTAGGIPLSSYATSIAALLYAPTLVLLYLAFRELLIARAEGRGNRLPNFKPPRGSRLVLVEGEGLTAFLARAQRFLDKVKRESSGSIWGLGFAALGLWIGSGAVGIFAASTSTSPLMSAVEVALAVASAPLLLLMVWVAYLYQRQWLESCQDLITSRARVIDRRQAVHEP